MFGLILAALASGLRFGHQAMRTQAHDALVGNEIGQADAMLRFLVARAWAGRAGGAATPFRGTAGTLSFRTTMPEGWRGGPGGNADLPRTGDAEVTIDVDAGHRLRLLWSPRYRNWIVPRPTPARVDLLTGVDHVEFAYWDPALNLPPSHWAAAWAGASVPKLLRIRLVFVQDSGRRWPDIIVATAHEDGTP